MLSPARPTPFTTAPDIILIATAVAAHTIGDVGDALFLVFLKDVPQRVFVTAVARVGSVVAGLVAGGALRVVVTVQSEVLRVIERGRRPCACAMAAGTVVLVALVEVIGG